MADRISLGVVGTVFGAVTLAVMAIAVFVVMAHVNGRYAIDDGRAPVVSASVASPDATAPAISAAKKSAR